MLFLFAPGHGQSVRLDIRRNHRSGPDDRTRADGHRRHQRTVRANERARADIGEGFAETIIIAGNGPRADIGFRTDAGVADIGQVIDLGSGFHRGLLDFNEIADMGILADIRPRPQPAQRGR